MKDSILASSPEIIETSPLPDNTQEIKQLSFPDAIREVIEGKKITKLEWSNEEYYGVLHEGILCIHKPDDKFHPWTLNDGDLLGTDWVVLDNKN